MSLTFISIAGVSIALDSPMSPCDMRIQERLGAFLVDSCEGQPSVFVRWNQGEPLLPTNCELIYDPGEIWRMYRARGGRPYHALIRYPSSSGGIAGEALIEANRTWDDLLLTERPGGSNWGSLLSAGAGELILRTSLVLSRGLVFHACGIDDGGRGLLFAGHSGAGKSTQAALWTTLPGIVVMNDDRVAVCAGDGRITCHGIPWGGTLEIAKNHSAPLAAILLLEQAAGNAIRRLTAEESFPLLAPCAFLPYWDPELMQRALDMLCEILSRVPAYMLQCRAEFDVVSLVRSVL